MTLADSYAVVLEMAKDAEETPLQYMIVELGWGKDDAELWLHVASALYRAGLNAA